MSHFNLKALNKPGSSFVGIFLIWIIFEIVPHDYFIGHLIGLVLTIAVIVLEAIVLKARLARHHAKA